MPPRNGYALFPTFPVPKSAAELRFLRRWSLLWVLRLAVVGGGLLLLHAAGAL